MYSLLCSLFLIVCVSVISEVSAFTKGTQPISNRPHFATKEEDDTHITITDDLVQHESSSKETTRRKTLQQMLTVASGITTSPAISSAATSTTSSVIPTPPQVRQTTWPLGKVAFSLLPLAGSYSRRATVMEELVPGKIWTFDQIQGSPRLYCFIM